jgi:hypothetical protein
MLIGCRGLRALIVCCGAFVLDPKLCAAQTTAQFPVQFDFLTPGARSLALGGAYIGAADDVTAAFTNPAGLAFFKQRELSLEVRLRSLQTPFLSAGRISGTTTGIGEDTISGPVYGGDVDTSLRPSFIAVVMPLRTHRISFAAYRHDLVHIENAFFSRGPFERVTFFGIIDDRNREIPIDGTRDVRITTYGGSVAWARGNFGLGGGISVSTFRLDARFARHGFVSSIFGLPDTGLTSATTTQSGEDAAVSGNIGAVWTTSDDRLTVGATFRRGPEFSFVQHDQVIGGLDVTRGGTFKVPDTWGVGILWSGIPHTRLLVDYDRVQYSQLIDDFITIQALSSSGRPEQLAIDDANEIHGGLEYRRQLRSRDVAFRGGAWWDPDHAVRYVPTAAHDEVDTLFAATLPGGSSVVHYTFGGAFTVSKWVIDAGTDLSSRSKSLTVSLLVRF